MNQTNKKQGKPPNNTIDEKHTEMLDSFFETDTKTIPDLTKQKTSLAHYLNTLKENQIEERMDIQDKIRDMFN